MYQVRSVWGEVIAKYDRVDLAIDKVRHIGPNRAYVFDLTAKMILFGCGFKSTCTIERS